MKKDKNVKLRIVSLSDAVINPGAVVVVSVDTALTKSAVTASRCSNHFTVGTEAACLESV